MSEAALLVFTCSKSKFEILDERVKSVKSYPKRHPNKNQWRRSGVIIVDFNRFYIYFCFHCWLWILSKCRLDWSESFSIIWAPFKARYPCSGKARYPCNIRVRISSVNVAKSAGNCRFGHIHWRNPYWKTWFFVQCKLWLDHF